MTPTASFESAKFVGDPQLERRDDEVSAVDFLALLSAVTPIHSVPVETVAEVEPESSEFRPAVDCTDLPIPNEGPATSPPPTIGTHPILLPQKQIPEQKGFPLPEITLPEIEPVPLDPQTHETHRDILRVSPAPDVQLPRTQEVLMEDQSGSPALNPGVPDLATVNAAAQHAPAASTEPDRPASPDETSATEPTSIVVSVDPIDRPAERPQHLNIVLENGHSTQASGSDRLAVVTAEPRELPRPDEKEDIVSDRRTDRSASSVGDTILRKFSTDFEAARPERVVEIPPQELVEQIVPKLIEVATPEGSDRRLMKMRLHPAELGSVEIELEREEGGSLTARIHTESAAAQHILVEGLDQLRDALQNSGWTINELQVDSGLGSASGGDGDGHSPSRQPGRGPDSPDSAAQTFNPQEAAAAADGILNLWA